MSTPFIKHSTWNIDNIDDDSDDDKYNCSDDENGSDNTDETLQIKYVEGDQKLMVTVERCEGLKKESGVFGGDHRCEDDNNNHDDCDDDDDDDY